MIVILVSIVLVLLVLVKASDLVVNTLEKMAVQMKWNPFGVAAVVLAIAVSLPELMVGLLAAIQGDSQLALGNVIGSNIADLSLIMGVAVLLVGKIKATDRLLSQDVVYAFLACGTALLLLLDGELNRSDGVILLIVYGIYMWRELTIKKQKAMRTKAMPVYGNKRFLSVWQQKPIKQNLGLFSASLLTLLVSAQILINLTSILTIKLGISSMIVGLVVVALGSSLPELAVAIEAVKLKEMQMVLGNVLGAVVVNSTAILGLVGIISPINIQAEAKAHWMAAIMFSLTFFIFWGLMRSKRQLERWEGGVLVLLYAGFIWLEKYLGVF